MHYDQRAEPGRHWKGEQHHVRRPVGSRAAALDRRHIDRRTRRIDSGEGTAALAGKGIGGCWPGKAQSGRPQRPRDRR